MPKAQHRALKKVAKKKGLTGKRADRFVFGTMNSSYAKARASSKANGSKAKAKPRKAKAAKKSSRRY